MLSSTIRLIQPFLLFSLVLIATLFISRLGLSVWQFERISNLESLVTLLFNGIRIDLSVIGYLLLVPALIHPWAMRSNKLSVFWIKAVKFIFVAIFISVLFFELADRKSVV